jgi:hypothetical protein
MTRKTKYSSQAKKFVIRLAEGMVGWAAFAQAAHLSKMYSEYLTYLPIFEIGKGRGWNVLPQKKLKRSKSGKGRFKTVDFVFRSENKEIGIFLEVKYARFNTEHCLQVTKDIRKLCELDGSDISPSNPPSSVLKCILIVGQKENILQRLRKTSKDASELTIKKLTYFEDKRLLKQVKSSIDAASDRSSASDRHSWAFYGAGSGRWNYWCVLISEQAWWQSLQNIDIASPVEEDEVNENEAAIDNLDHVPPELGDE